MKYKVDGFALYLFRYRYTYHLVHGVIGTEYLFSMDWSLRAILILGQYTGTITQLPHCPWSNTKWYKLPHHLYSLSA